MAKELLHAENGAGTNEADPGKDADPERQRSPAPYPLNPSAGWLGAWPTHAARHTRMVVRMPTAWPLVPVDPDEQLGQEGKS